MSQDDVYTRIKWNGWGYKDKILKLDPQNPLIAIHSNGKKVRHIVPFVHTEIRGLTGAPQPLVATQSISFDEASKCLPPAVLNQLFLADLKRVLTADQVKMDAEARLTHMFGKNYRDLWRARKGMIARAPDAIVLPQSHADCVKLMECAVKHNVVLIPFGGGTNVVGCTEAPLFEQRRMVVSVDMRRMNRMLSIDKESRTAVFECGVLGPDLDEQIGRHGFMFGHDPDSYIHSTLGGWIGARSSGALSNTYGDLEQMVLALKVVTPTGVVETPVQVRPCGIDLNGVLVGSEGCFGIITEATVKIEPIPEAKLYEGWFFPSFEAGFRAFYEVTRKQIRPTAMRLYDEDETRMSLAMRTDTGVLQHYVGAAVKAYLQHVKEMDLQNMALCIMGYEGTKEDVAHVKKQIGAIFARYGGFCAGKGVGLNWQEKKYDLPLVRDFALAHGLWADVFETCTVYSDALALWSSVKKAVREVWKAEGKTGWIGCHTAHQYRSGCCLYFTFAGVQHDDNDIETLLKIKRAATAQMLKYKGNLTHHHGIGYEHVPWMSKMFAPGALDLMLALKQQVDPQDICNPWKLLPLARKPKETEEQLAERRSKMQLFDRMGVPRMSKL